MGEIFRFLHMSDVHFKDERIMDFITYEEIKEKLSEFANTDGQRPPDCMLISGDIFHQGKIIDGNKAVDFLKEIKSLFPGMAIIVCPGNHDLDRNARIKLSGYGKYKDRKELVNDYGKKAAAGESIQLDDDAKQVLYKKAFADFLQFSNDNEFSTFKDTNADLEPEEYEFNIFDFNIGQHNCIRFVLLNTALFSGQTLDEEGYKERIKSKYKEIISGTNPVETADAQKKLQTFLSEYGEIIIDDETSEENGRLGLSKEGNEELIEQSKMTNGKIISAIFFVGHHEFEYLNKDTQIALMKVISYFEEENLIYLCGHAHQPEISSIVLKGEKTAKQYRAGTVCYDESGWAQYSISDITVQEYDGFKFPIIVKCHYAHKAPNGDLAWSLCQIQKPKLNASQEHIPLERNVLQNQQLMPADSFKESMRETQNLNETQDGGGVSHEIDKEPMRETQNLNETQDGGGVSHEIDILRIKYSPNMRKIQEKNYDRRTV